MPVGGLLLPLFLGAFVVQRPSALRETVDDVMRVGSFTETAEHLNELRVLYLQQLENSFAHRENATVIADTNQTVAESRGSAEMATQKLGHTSLAHSVTRAALGPNPTTLSAVIGLLGLVAFAVCFCTMCRRSSSKIPGAGRNKKLGPKAHAESSSEDEFKRETPKSPGDEERASVGKDQGGAEDGAAAVAAKAAESAQEQQRRKVNNIEECAKQVQATIMKLPRNGGMFSRAQERYIVAEPEKRDDNSSWSRQLQYWKRGRLAYWKNLEAYKERQEPKGSIDLMSITKVSIPFENREQVIVKQKDEQAEDSFLILQFKDNKRAQAWKEAFKELRGHIV